MDAQNKKYPNRMTANNKCKTINPELKFSSHTHNKKSSKSKEKKEEEKKNEEYKKIEEKEESRLEAKININSITNNNQLRKKLKNILKKLKIKLKKILKKLKIKLRKILKKLIIKEKS